MIGSYLNDSHSVQALNHFPFFYTVHAGLVAGLPLEKSEVILGEGAFRNVGEYDVVLHLHADVETTVKVIVESDA